jgi:hypothetical protein
VAVVPKDRSDFRQPHPRAQDLGGHAHGNSTGGMNRRRGHSIEPTGTGDRAHMMGAVAKIARAQGTVPLRRYSEHEVAESVTSFPGFQAFDDVVRKLYASSKVLESIRATARRALSLPPGNTAPRGAREPDPGTGPCIAPRCEIVSSSPSASVIPSPPASGKAPAIALACPP